MPGDGEASGTKQGEGSPGAIDNSSDTMVPRLPKLRERSDIPVATGA